jgi:hypothetical protein
MHLAIVWAFTCRTTVAPRLSIFSVAQRIKNFCPCDLYVVPFAEGLSTVTLPGPVVVLNVEEVVVIEDVTIEDVYEAEA